MQDYGLVSVITPSYNCAAHIGKTIESIQAQTYSNWELLITDDCSTDESCSIIEDYVRKDNRIKLFALDKNSGAGVARNNSIKKASGRFIAFCDSDDRWYPQKLEKQLSFMLEKDCALSYTSYDVTDETGKLTGFVRCLQHITYAQIIRDDGIGCLTAIYDAAKIGKFYMPDVRKRQDWCLWISIIKQTRHAYGLDESLALYLVRKGSISSNKLKLIKHNFNVYNLILGYNKIVSFLLLFGYFMPYYIYKKLKQKYDFRYRLKTIE